MRRGWQLSLTILLGFLVPVGFLYSQDAPEEESTLVPAQTNSVTSSVAGDNGLVDAQSFKQSRLTRDETEARADRRSLLLTTGEDKVVDLDFDVEGDKYISTGNPGVVVVQVISVAGTKRQLVFKPLKSGETTVTIRDAEGSMKLIFRVLVSGSNLEQRAAEIRSLLLDIDGLDINIVGQKIVIDGEVLVPNDYARMLAVIQDKSYADLIINLASISPVALQYLAKKIQEDIVAFAQAVKTRVVNGVIFLEGTVDDAGHSKRAEEVAKLYLPDVKPGNPLLARDGSAVALPARPLVQNFIVVNPAPPKKQDKLVRVTVHFVELSKDYNKVFGFKWEPGFTAAPQISVGQPSISADGTTAATSGASFSATLSNLFPRLQSAQSAGYARVLKTGTLLTRSGQAANLREETEFPITVIGGNGQATSTSKPVGLSVAVTPQILGQSGDIQLDLKLNQTNLVGRAPAAGSAPVTAAHAVETKLYVKNNESAAIVGVTSGEVLTQFNRDDPAAGTFAEGTQPLFSLLRSKQYVKKRSQFVIFVTPQIVENASEGTEDLKKNFRVKVK